MSSSSIPVEVIEDARSLAERNGTTIGIWEAQPNKGNRGFVVMPTENMHKFTERIEIKGFTTNPTGEEIIPNPITTIDPPVKYRRGTDLYRRQRSGWRKQPKIEQEIGVRNIELTAPDLRLVAKVKMNKNEWVKIGESQGWIKSKDDPANMKVALPVLPLLGVAANLASPFIINWMMSSGEQPSQDPQQFQGQMQQMSQEVKQQADQVLKPTIQAIQQQAARLNAYCANDTQSPPCPPDGEVKDINKFKQKLTQMQQKMKSTQFSNDPMYVCQLYREALELNSCAASVIGMINEVKNNMQNMEFNPAANLRL